MENIGGNQQEILLTIGKFGEYKTEVKERTITRGRLALRAKVKEEPIEIYGGLREEIGVKMYLHGPMDYAKTLKLRFQVGDLDLPERRERYTSSREEEDDQICPRGKAIESRM